MSAVDGFAASRNGVRTAVRSLEDLATIPSDSQEPILVKIDGNRHSYRVIDGSATYEYVNGGRPADDEPRDALPGFAG
jgi:hypothetical protein